MRFNGVTSKKSATLLMSIWAGVAEKSRHEVSTLELLSKVAAIELPLFVRQHSTLPLRRGITSYQPELLHGSEENRSMLWTTGMRLARTGAYFCAECVHEDQSFHGQSYWRREHQIPGLLWCPKHTTPLKYVEDESAFLRPPAEYLYHCQSVAETWALEALGNKAIQRYLEISSGLMERASPLDVKRVSVLLKEKASAFGFQTHGGTVKSPLLSDAVVNEFGRPWLATVLPALADKPTGVFLSQLDGVLFLKTSASSVSAYILACAVLFDSADAALNALQSLQADIKKCRQRSSGLERAELVEAYVQARGNHSVAASLISASKPTVIARLRAIGLPNLIESPTRSSVRAAIAFFLENRSLAESAAIGGMGQDAMEDLLRNVGCDMAHALREMQRPSGRGSGVRRPRQLTPGEATSATGRMATKYSLYLRSEQRKAFQPKAIDVQNVLQ